MPSATNNTVTIFRFLQQVFDDLLSRCIGMALHPTKKTRLSSRTRRCQCVGFEPARGSRMHGIEIPPRSFRSMIFQSAICIALRQTAPRPSCSSEMLTRIADTVNFTLATTHSLSSPPATAKTGFQVLHNQHLLEAALPSTRDVRQISGAPLKSLKNQKVFFTLACVCLSEKRKCKHGVNLIRQRVFLRVLAHRLA